MVDSMESWENVSKGKVLVNKFDANNQETQVVVASGRKVLVTPKERQLLNQDRCYSADADIFQNGRLRPVSGVTIADGPDGVAENPNHMSKSDMKNLFDLQWKQFDTAVNEITSRPLLDELLNLVNSDDHDEGFSPTVRQRDVILARLDEVSGSSSTMEIDHAGDLGMDEGRGNVGKFRV